jgi:glycosyltransferase involved in cell wall biosynthesis
LGADERASVALYLGRIAEAKGVFELARAVLNARSAAPQLICWLVGAKEGYDQSDTLRSVLDRAGGRAAVRVLPACAPEKIWQYFAAADFFVFPSHGEGMPNSLLEAMSAGLAAIAYAIPAVEEIDDGNAAVLKVAPRDQSALSEAIVKFATQTQTRAEFARRGSACVRARFQASDRMAEAAQRIAALVQSSKFKVHRQNLAVSER